MKPHITALCSAPFALAFGILNPSAVAAQAADTQASASDAGIQDIIVTARKREESVQDVPVAISAFSGDALRSRNISNVADLVRIAPGVTVTPSSRSVNGVRFILRGLAPADSLLATDASTAIYFDGVYVPRDYGMKVAMFDVERTEILKGPQGTLYGRNSTGGAVNIFGRKPDLNQFGGFGTAEFGSYSTGQMQAALNIPLVDGVLAARIAGSGLVTDGFATGFNGSRIGDRQDVAVRGSLLYKPTENFSLLATLGVTRSSGAHLFFKILEVLPGVNQADVEFGAQLGNPVATPIQQGAAGVAGDTYLRNAMAAQTKYGNSEVQGVGENFHGTRGSVTATWELSEAAVVKSVTGYEDFHRSTTQDLDTTPLPVATVATRTRDKFFSEELQLGGALLDKHVNYVLGGYYARETGNEYANTVILPTLAAGRAQVFDADVKNTSYGAFFQADVKPVDRLTITGGVRYNSDRRDATVRTRNEFPTFTQCRILPSLLDAAGVCRATLPQLKFNRVTYTGSIAYAVTDGVNVYATARSGFRSGGYTIFTDMINGVTSFRPDKVNDIEVGLKSELLDRRLRFNIAAYRSKYADIQKSTLTFVNGVSTRAIKNAARATVKGVEADLTARPVGWLDINATLAHTDAGYDEFIERDLAGNVVTDRTAEPFEVPRWTYSIGVAVHKDVGAGQLMARADWYWRSSTIFSSSAQLLPTEQILRQTSYGLLSGRIEWSLSQSGLSVAILGRNLLDKYYLAGGTDLRALGFSLGLPGEPRYVGLQLTKKWGGG